MVKDRVYVVFGIICKTISKMPVHCTSHHHHQLGFSTPTPIKDSGGVCFQGLLGVGTKKVPLRDFLTKQEGLLGTKGCFLGLNEEDSQGEYFLGLFRTFPTMPLHAPIAPLSHGVVWLLFFCILAVTWSFNNSREGLATF